MRLLRRAFNVLDGAEAGFALSLAFLAGTTLAGALVVGMPLSMAWTLYAHGRIAAAGLIAALVVLAIVSVVRDLKRRRLSWPSAALGALWVVCVVYVGARLILDG